MFDFLIDFVFPKFCVGCNRIGKFLCTECLKTIERYPQLITLELEHKALDSVTAMAIYGSAIAAAITELKYHSVRDIGKTLGDLICANTHFPACDAITAVPLHADRQKERGFNQAEVIAKKVSSLSGIPYFPLLSRNKKTTSQVVAGSREARLAQLAQAFGPTHFFLSNQEIFFEKTVLIIDDVITTGATVNECAIVLKQLGFSQVHALAVAHGQS